MDQDQKPKHPNVVLQSNVDYSVSSIGATNKYKYIMEISGTKEELGYLRDQLDEAMDRGSAFRIKEGSILTLIRIISRESIIEMAPGFITPVNIKSAN